MAIPTPLIVRPSLVTRGGVFISGPAPGGGP
jgi:hypothetical protein